MAPKRKISKQDIINASVEMVREKGVEVLNARALASHIGCSTQPIFSNYSSMEELRKDVLLSAASVYESYVTTELNANRYPKYKATGMAYICFAKEEKELFKLLFMRDRTKEMINDSDAITENVISIIQNTIGLSKEQARRFHLEMWIYVHGIATILATSYLPLEWEDISSMVTDAYEGLKKRYVIKEKS